MSIFSKAVKLVKAVDKCIDYDAENNTVVVYLSAFAGVLDVFKGD